MKSKKYVENLLFLLGEGKIDQVIEVLKVFLKDSIKSDKVFLQSVKYNDLRKQILQGTINRENSEVIKNQITLALKDTIETLNKKTPTSRKLEGEIEKTIRGSKISFVEVEAGEDIDIKVNTKRIDSLKTKKVKAGGSFNLDINNGD